MFKTNGRYYVCSSDLHGWTASHSYTISATSILGTYGTEGVIGNTDLDFSPVTQTGLFITVKGTAQDTVIFGGDRWPDFAGNGSRRVSRPLAPSAARLGGKPPPLPLVLTCRFLELT